MSELDCDRILTVIDRLSFVFARTMPHMPHEYTLRDRAPNDADYVALYEAIMRDGVIHWWRRQHARYLYPGDGWCYWSMSAKRSDANAWHPLWISHHINRNRIEERPKLIASGMLSLERPDKPATRFMDYPAEPPRSDIPVHQLGRFAGRPPRRRHAALSPAE
jgi:hypothetical protein